MLSKSSRPKSTRFQSVRPAPCGVAMGSASAVLLYTNLLLRGLAATAVSAIGMTALLPGRALAADTEPGVAAADAVAELAAQIDRILIEETGGESVERAAQAGDETFLRRVWLDVTGVPPAPEAVISFTKDRDPDKRAKVVQSLLDDPRYGQNWARYWRDVILYRRTEERALLVSASLEAFLKEQLNANAPWDQIVSSFITAEGDVRENGATGLIMAQGGQPEDVVSEISRIFLGIQIQCAQCHDHPTDRWKREQFHELAAFFPRVAVRPDRTGPQRSFLVTVNDRPFAPRGNNNNRFVGSPEHYMPDLDDPAARGTLMTPAFFVSGAALEVGSPDALRRWTLATAVTSKENPWFAKALANRLWAELVGEGFYEPVDDLGPDRTASAPRTLEHLAKAFSDSDYNIKQLMRVIMATDAYQQASRVRRGAEESPFLANCSQRLRGDQLYDALASLLGIPDQVGLGGPGRGPYGMGGGPRALFNATFGFDPSERKDELAGSIPQALAMMNSPLIAAGASARRGSRLGRLLSEIPDNEQLVVELYLRALSRQPSEAEIRTCLRYVKEVGDRNEAFEDILWSLINSAEFLHRK